MDSLQKWLKKHVQEEVSREFLESFSSQDISFYSTYLDQGGVLYVVRIEPYGLHLVFSETGHLAGWLFHESALEIIASLTDWYNVPITEALPNLPESRRTIYKINPSLKE